MKCVISNPPYNMPWKHTDFINQDPRFIDSSAPPETNANFAFVLSALKEADKVIFLLPTGILSGGTKEEKTIKKYLIDSNLISCIIVNPNNMFESTGVDTCILVLEKNRKSSYVMMIDASKNFVEEKREQRGQFGGKSHTNRIYTKTFKAYDKEKLDKILLAAKNRKEIEDFSKLVTIQEIKNNKYNLLPGHYFEIKIENPSHRELKDIVADYNKTVIEKNLLKLTINETLAKHLGLNDIVKLSETNIEIENGISETFEKSFGLKIEKENYLTLTKNKNEFKFENKSKETISHILLLIMNGWKENIFRLNNESNVYLAELRDALLSELMSGEMKILD